MSLNQSEDNIANTSHWEQFEQFKKKITQECQSDEKHFKLKRDQRDSYTSLEKIKKPSFHEEEPQITNSKPPMLVQPSETDRIVKLRMENQELKEKLEEIQKDNQDFNQIKESHAKQLKSQKEYYEIEKNNLKEKINQFNEELEELKKVYKEKNMKLYNLVLQLEQEKQELIEKNIALLEQQSGQRSNINIHQLVEERTRILAEQIEQLEERNAKLQMEKSKIEDKYMNLLQKKQSTPPQKSNSHRSNIKSVEKRPPIPIHDNKSAISQSFDSLPPMQKSILKNSKLQTSQVKEKKEKENLSTTNRSRVSESSKMNSSHHASSQKKQQKPKKKQIYTKVK